MSIYEIKNGSNLINLTYKHTIGEIAEVLCAAYGKPNLIFFWYKVVEGANVEVGNSGNVTAELDNTGRLILTNAYFNDAGEYVCRAENEVGEASESVSILVLGNINYYI